MKKETCIFCFSKNKYLADSYSVCTSCLERLKKFSNAELKSGIIQVQRILTSIRTWDEDLLSADGKIFKGKLTVLELFATGGNHGHITQCFIGRKLNGAIRLDERPNHSFKIRRTTTFRKSKSTQPGLFRKVHNRMAEGA